MRRAGAAAAYTGARVRRRRRPRAADARRRSDLRRRGVRLVGGTEGPRVALDGGPRRDRCPRCGGSRGGRDERRRTVRDEHAAAGGRRVTTVLVRSASARIARRAVAGLVRCRRARSGLVLRHARHGTDVARRRTARRVRPPECRQEDTHGEARREKTAQVAGRREAERHGSMLRSLGCAGDRWKHRSHLARVGVSLILGRDSDLDGVVTDTARGRAAAGARLFDEFL